MNLTENIECVPTGNTLTKNEEKPEKDTTKISGIYKIINKVNGRYYVGSSSNIYKRWSSHKNFLIKNSHYNIYLQRAWNKYGKSNFDFVICEKTSKNQLIKTEQKYLNKLKNKQCECYNLRFIAEGGGWSEYSRKKFSKNKKRFFKNKLNHPRFGKHLTEKTKELLRIKCPKYGKENGMFGVKRCGKNNPNYDNHKLKGKNNPAFNSNEYHFVNKHTKEEFTGCMYDFYTKYKLSQGNINFMVNKEPWRSVKGWSLITN